VGLDDEDPGATYLRAGIVNYLSSQADVDRMLHALRRLSPQAADTPPT
jgi:ActR/RegA family two-component response regulator